MVKTDTKKILLTFRNQYLRTIDMIVKQGGAKSRSDFIEKLVIGFISDLTHHRTAHTAQGGYVTFIHNLFARTEETTAINHQDELLKTIAKLQKRFPSGVPITKVFPQMKKIGVSQNQTRQLIEALRYQGVLYETQPESYLLTTTSS